MQVNDETRPAGTAVRHSVQQLTVPNGFTLTIGSVLVVTIGDRGYPGMLPVWLFAVGGSAGFCLVALISRASATLPPALRPGTGLTVFNLVPVVVVPIVYAATRWVPVAWLAFATAGFLAVVLYLAGYSAFAAWTKRLQPGGSGIYPACPASVRGGRAVLARVPAVARTSRRHGAGFWLVAAAFLMSMAFSAAPAPLYPVYEQRDRFSTFTVTIVFAVYAAGVIVSLLAAGRISDWVGRKRTLIPALALQVAAAVILSRGRRCPGCSSVACLQESASA